jgi:hypothetical protein
MTSKDQKAVASSVVRVLRALGLAGLYARFAPEVRRGNQPDMPIITTNKIWFLRENQFLVFTRGGPVEVTLKPSLVLTGILICMAGVAATFLFDDHCRLQRHRGDARRNHQDRTS